MRRILVILASALVIAVLTLGLLHTSDLLRLDDWSQWAAGVGFFAMGGSVAGDIWWREFQQLRESKRKRRQERRERPRKSGTHRSRGTKLVIRTRRRAHAARRSLRSSSGKVDRLVFFGVLLLLLTAVVLYNYEDFVVMIRLVFGPWS